MGERRGKERGREKDREKETVETVEDAQLFSCTSNGGHKSRAASVSFFHPPCSSLCCARVCVCLLCFFQFSHFVGEERKEERKEGQRDKSDPSNGGREEGEGVRDMNYYRALVHGKGADRRTVTLFVKYNFERFGRQQFFPSSSPLFPLFFFEGERRSEIALREFGEGRFLFLSIVIRILYNNYYKVK